MSLDGLRAWIGVVERKLTMRTRVFLVLVAIAVGGAAVGIYLAVEAQNDAVTKDDLQTVRDELAGSAPQATVELSQLESELEALRGEVATLRSEGEAKGSGGTGTEVPGGGESTPNKTNGGAGAP
jgi:phage repressor protein C with HTH and peptisase S24 domain